MIFGHINNLKQEKSAYGATLQKALEFLQKTDFSAVPAGKYELDGDKMYYSVSEYQTEPKTRRRAEAHRKYIDIQYIVKGEEMIAHSFLTPGLTVLEDKLQEKDVIFYEIKAPELELYLVEGSYGIFFPEDVHRPNCAVSAEPVAVKKVVVKIKVDAL